MRRCLLPFFFAALFLALPVDADRIVTSTSTVANLPSTCSPTGNMVIVTDGTTTEDCSTGGGSTIHACYCDAAGTGFDAQPAALNEDCFGLMVETITTSDDWEIELPPWTGVMTDFRCEADGGTSFTVNVCDGEDLGDDTCTTSVLGGTLVCGTAGANDNTLSATGFAANDSVSIVVTAVSGSVTWARMSMDCTRD